MSLTQSVSEKIVSCIDLTSLNETDNHDSIKALCSKADTPLGQVAAVCVLPRFVPYVRNYLDDFSIPNVSIATVTNFPEGSDDLSIAFAQTKAAVAYGADEVDVVFPYNALLADNPICAARLVSGCKAICGDEITLKVILETGALKAPELIIQACEIAIASGADFLKTSTGKIAEGASLEAARIIMEIIRSHDSYVGLKVSGGIKNAEQAAEYLNLAESVMGVDWVNPFNFRIGASTLLDSLISG